MTTKKEKVCCICGEKIDGQAYKKGKKTYCSACMEDEDADWFDWCNLYEYIKKLNNTKDVSLRIITQLKRYKKENKLTDYGMLNTLKYIYEIDKQIALNSELDSVGLIPYYYDEASKYFQNTYLLHHNNKVLNLHYPIQYLMLYVYQFHIYILKCLTFHNLLIYFLFHTF